jgi:hypothetical protein
VSSAASPRNARPTAGSSAAGPLVVRPRKIAVFGSIAAAAVLATMIVLGILLQSDGIPLRLVDKIGFMSVGVAGAAAIMLVARPRIVADEKGMRVRNVLGDTTLPWPVVLKIAFPPGAHWAQAVLADDETYPLMAIQAMDRQRAVDALKCIRALHTEPAPAAPQPSPEALERARRRAIAEAAAAASRPLGRLEQIDRRMAELGPKPKRRRRSR